MEKEEKIAKNFLVKMFGPSIDVIGGALADRLQPWRLKNQLRNFEKVKKIIAKEKVEIKKINMKVLFPYLEHIALEEDETLQDKWANLFVNYVDAKKNLTTTVYPSILSQLSTHDVELIDFMRKNSNTLRINKANEVQKNSLTNLIRLGLVSQLYNLTTYNDRFNGMQAHAGEILPSPDYYFSDFGKSFVNALYRSKPPLDSSRGNYKVV